MKEKILIVEDEYVVANDLRYKLTSAGYTVCGIASSVREARELVDLVNPSWVLLDIFLLDGSRGTELAGFLRERNIGFIYISANTNQSTLEAVKETEPYGFLVKPFREKDLVIMLEIATQKHKHNLELFAQRELIWRRQLENMVESEADSSSRLTRIPLAFQSFIPFDLMMVRLLDGNEKRSAVYSFLREGYEEYKVFRDFELHAFIGIKQGAFSKYEQLTRVAGSDIYLNGAGYKRATAANSWEEKLCAFFRLESMLLKQINFEHAGSANLSFYSRSGDGYSALQMKLLQKTEKTLKQLLSQLGALDGANSTPQPRHKQPDPGSFISSGPDGIVGNSTPLMRVLDRVSMVAASDSSVLVLGESGTGKERIAKYLHKLSPRNQKPLVVLNCSALPLELIESELFGHEKGAFTGAMERRIGKFELANGGTIFLDEIGELPLAAQVKLLRVLQEREFERVGSATTVKVDVRIIAATNKNLEQEVARGTFRLDLFYRLNVFPIELPPLRERKEDIILLAESFLRKFAQKSGKHIIGMSSKFADALLRYNWPGNVRELEHMIERSVLTAAGSQLTDACLGSSTSIPVGNSAISMDARTKTLQENEAEHIIGVLKRCNGRVGGRGGAAELLGLPVSTLHSRMKKLGIRKEFDYDQQ